MVRSTVPVGTSREVVLPPLRDVWGEALLVMAPERTIQGQALRELVELPQVVGGLDERSLARGVEFFAGLARQVVPVSTLETAELVKLTNNCHTDVIYAFGNEVAMLTERLGLDPLEVIRATNLDYPRPDIAKPGYVGGGCLSKDPYIMLAGSGRSGHTPELIRSARTLNEELPAHVARRVVDLLGEVTGGVAGRRLAVLGWAYKGWPPTDDMRGTPIATMMPVFEAAGVRVVGHDPLVGHDVIRAYGGEPVDVATAFATSDAVLVITDHPDYRRLDVDDVARRLAGPAGLRLVADPRRRRGPRSRGAVRRSRLRAQGAGGGARGGPVVRALILGGAGFIGVHLARRLVADGHDVTVVDDFSRGRQDPELEALDVAVRARRPHRPRRVPGPAGRVGPRLHARGRGRRPERGAGPRARRPGQHPRPDAPAGLARTAGPALLRLDQRGVRRRREPRAGPRPDAGDGAARHRGRRGTPVHVRDQQAARRSGGDPHREQPRASPT